jgi:fibronectin-binding autotransporter adhesin
MAVVLAGVSAPLSAQVTWTGGGADGFWTTSGNWSTTLPATSGSLVFSGGVFTSSTNNAAVTTATLMSFTNDGTAGKTAAFTLSGSAISLAGTMGISTTAVTSGPSLLDTIGMNLALTSTTGTTTISTGSSHDLQITGVMSGGSLRKTGVGSLTLAGNNSYSGSTIVNAGVLRVAGSGTAFGGGTVTLDNAAGATLDINGFNQSIAALAGGGATGGSILLNSGTLSVGSANTSTTYSGSFSGTPGTLVKQGIGILTLNGASSTFAGVDLQAGKLSVTSGTGATMALGTLSRSAGSSLTLASSTGAVPGAFTVSASTPTPNGIIGPWAFMQQSGTWGYATQSAGVVSRYTGATAAAAIVNVTGTDDTANFDVNSAVTGNTATGTVSINTLRLASPNNAAVTMTISASRFTTNGLMASDQIGRLSIAGNAITIGANRDLVIANFGAGTTGDMYIDTNILESAAGRSGITLANSRSQTVFRCPNSTFTGDINVLTGGGVTWGTGGSVNGAHGNVNLSGGGFTVWSSGTVSFEAVHGVGTTLTKQASGLLRITGTNGSYTGATSITNGTLEVNSLPAIGSFGGLGNPTAANGTISIGSLTGSGTLRYVGSGNTTDRAINLAGTTGGATIDARGGGALTITGLVTSSDTTAKIFTLTGTSTAANVIGIISGTNLSVVKDGPGRWRLTGTSTFNGTLTVKNGTLVAAANAGETGSSVFGTQNPIVGDTTPGATGTAALLVEAGISIQRDVTVASGVGVIQSVLIGGASESGTVTFASGKNLNIGRDVALVARPGGTVTFSNNWTASSGTGTPTANVAIGADGYTGAVRLLTTGTLATGGAIGVRYGTAVLGASTTLDGVGTLAIDSGATLAGIGTVAGPLGGAGLVGPGNSPGILTAEAFDASGGLGAAFEFSGTAAPNYGSASNSLNDVLRLTGTAPFLTSTLGTSSVVNVYLPSTVTAGDVFLGGFFADAGGDFSSLIQGATYNYWVAGSGTHVYNSGTYAPLGLTVNIGTTPQTSGTFANGDQVNGTVSTFTVVVPEPAAVALAGIGIAAAAWTIRRRRRR